MNWKRRYRKLKNPLSKLGITLCSQVAILSLTQSLEHPHSLFISKKCFWLQVLISKEPLLKPEGHLLFSKNDVGRAGNYSLGSVKAQLSFHFELLTGMEFVSHMRVATSPSLVKWLSELQTSSHTIIRLGKGALAGGRKPILIFLLSWTRNYLFQKLPLLDFPSHISQRLYYRASLAVHSHSYMFLFFD